MKQFCKDGLGYEYFARNRRRMAAWKSEAEFRALFQERIGDSSTAIKSLEADFESLVDYCQSKTGTPIVDHQIFSILEQEKEEAEVAKENKEIPKESYEDIMRGIEAKQRLSKALEDVASELDIEFEFLIIFQKKFSSSFKATIGQIPILFPNVESSVVPLENVINVLKSSSDRKSNFFHLFYKAKSTVDDEKKKLIVNTIAKKLIAEASRWKRRLPFFNRCGRTVSGMLGHADHGFTLRTYTHTNPKMLEETAATVGQVMAQNI